jgi:hypothetical protein
MSPAVHMQEFLFDVHVGMGLLGKYVNVHTYEIVPSVFRDGGNELPSYQQ